MGIEKNQETGCHSFRVRMTSRFRAQTHHELWIFYKIGEYLKEDPLTGYHCECFSGGKHLIEVLMKQLF